MGVYLLSVPLQEELSTSLKKRVHIESRIGTSSGFDSGIAGLSSTSQLASSSQLEGMYHAWALCWAVMEIHSLLPAAVRGIDKRLQPEFHLFKFL